MYHLCHIAEKQTAGEQSAGEQTTGEKTAGEQKTMRKICGVTASDIAKTAAKLGKNKILRVCTIV